MNPSTHFIDESLLGTPQPKANSTIFKEHDKNKKLEGKCGKFPLNYSSASEGSSSLGVLNERDIQLLDNATVGTDAISRLRTQRKLAESLIERANRTAGLPSKYFKAHSMSQRTNTSDCPDNSTVSESDLLKQKESVSSQTFYPNNISTPKSSDIAEKPLETSIFQNITEMSEKIRSSNISLQDICSELQRETFTRFSTSRISGIDSHMFVPAELMSDVLRKDEMSWRQKRDLPLERLQESIKSTPGCGKHSIGEYFKTRNNDLGDLFEKKSPEKPYTPIPLVDVTNISTVSSSSAAQSTSRNMVPSTESSVMSITQIAKALSELTCNTTSKAVDHLFNNGKPEKGHKRTSKINEKKSLSLNITDIPLKSTTSRTSRENDCDEYLVKKRLQRRSISPSNALHLMVSESQSRTKSPESEDESKLRYERISSISPVSSIGKENKEITPEYLSRCPSSLESIPEGKLPIKGNKLELVWGCLKLGRCSSQSCSIRNQLNQKIRMQVSVTGSSFRIVKETGDTEMLTSMIFILHPLETKSLSVRFCPTAIGAVYERLNFHPITKGEVKKNMQQTIKLYGYGGHTAFDITNIAKDSAGKLWLSLGPLQHKPTITQNFTINNNGVLSSFVMLELTSDSVADRTRISISPNETIIKPNERVIITVDYNTSKYDYRNDNEIIDVGTLKIVAGAEALRGRLRRLHTMLVQRSAPIDPFLAKLSKNLANEVMPTDLAVITESTGTVKDLLEQLVIKEIQLTLERDPEATLIGPVADFDDTTMYQTLFHESSDKQHEPTKGTKCGQFRVQPSSIFFSLPFKKEDTFLLHSNSVSDMTFEIEATEGFAVHPSDGEILSGGIAVLHITCTKIPPSGVGKISVYVGNEMMEVNVKAILVK